MNDVSCSAVMATRCKLEKKIDGLVLTTCERHRNKYTPFRNSTVRRSDRGFSHNTTSIIQANISAHIVLHIRRRVVAADWVVGELRRRK